MKNQFVFVIVLSLLAWVGLFAQTGTVALADIQVSTSVEDRAPVGADTTFSSNVGQLYCFTHFTGSEDTTSVSHIWYHKDKEMAKVELNVRSKNWRTWSSKRIVSDWTGKWRVEVVAANGDLLGAKDFHIKP